MKSLASPLLGSAALTGGVLSIACLLQAGLQPGSAWHARAVWLILASLLLLGGTWRLGHRPWTALLLGLTALLVFARDPGLFMQPRFWAEEASVYYRAAWVQPFWTALLEPHQGYYSLFANVAGLLARAVPMERAPLVTTTLAALIPLAIAGAIAVNDSPTLQGATRKAAAVVAAMVVGATGEIWLTTINSQHAMPLLAFLILIDPKPQRWKRICAPVLLLVLGLSSVATNFLAPLFLWRYVQQRDKLDRLLFAVLLVCSGIQFATILYCAKVLGPLAYYHASQSRSLTIANPLDVMAMMWRWGLSMPLFSNHWRLQPVAAWWLLALAVMARRHARALQFHGAALLLLTVLTVLGSLGMRGGERYAYPGAVIISLMLIHVAMEDSGSRLMRMLAASTWLLSVLVWSQTFLSSLAQFRDPAWPTWSGEVQRWRADPSHALQAHPVWPGQTRQGLIWNVPPPTAAASSAAH